jgi:hypothetical protein
MGGADEPATDRRAADRLWDNGPMRRLLILSCVLASAARAAVTIDPDFWESYQPYRQYPPETIRDLAALGEGDLLETARDIDGLELRVVGRRTRASALISARVVVDSVARRRLQVKTVPFVLSPNSNAAPTVRRRQVTSAEADALMALLDRSGFWDAPYTVPNSELLDCADGGQWMLEAIRPGTYQLIVRIECGGLDPVATGIRDFLLDLAGISVSNPTPGLR